MRRLTMISLLSLCIAAVSAVAASTQGKTAAPQTVDLKGTDGTALKASYYAAGKPGPAILLLHACNRDRSSWAHLAADAASRGFHVLALDYRGYGESGGQRFDDPQQQQWIADRLWPGDIDAAYTWLMSQSGVDKTRVAAAGASCGVNQSVQLASRHPEVRTVVLLSGPVNANGRTFLKESPSLPILAAASTGDGGAIAGMRWALGWSRNPANRFMEYKAAGHGTDMFEKEKALEPLILDWFDKHLRNAPAAARPAATAGAKPSPAEELWTAITAPGGAARAKELYEAAKKQYPDVALLAENEVNQFGYQRLQEGSAKDAVAIFQLNVDVFPGSANTYDSLSDAYLALGNKDEALKYAEKAIEMLPKDTEVPDPFKKAIREGAEKKISELKKK